MQNKNIIKIAFLAFIMLFLSFAEKKPVQAAFGFNYQGVGFYAYDHNKTGSAPVYRFANTDLGAYFFTSSEIEKADLLKNGYGFEYQGVALYAYDYNKAGTSPVYRFANRDLGIYFYTTSIIEKNYLINNDPGFEYQGAAFYAYDYNKTGSAPVYRFSNTDTGFYFFTASITEKNSLDTNASLGPEITVGLWSYTRDELRDDPFEIEANKSYRIKNNDGNTVAVIDGNTKTKVTYDGDKKLKIYDSVDDTLSYRRVYFEAADGNNENMIFDVHKPDSGLDEYRGKIKLQHSDDTRLTWVINTLPMEHYVWGDGELVGSGDMDHNRVMVTSFRTYGYWKLLYSTKYAEEGFKVNATPGNQLYKGYSYEKEHSRVKQAAQDTRGKVVMYDGDVAITPYSSWTDGRTRSFEERWGSDDYPWCESVDDPYGDYNGDYWSNSYKSTATLVNEGNHMVGLSAHGSLSLAHDEGWKWEDILEYYFDDIDIEGIY